MESIEDNILILKQKEAERVTMDKVFDDKMVDFDDEEELNIILKTQPRKKEERKYDGDVDEFERIETERQDGLKEEDGAEAWPDTERLGRIEDQLNEMRRQQEQGATNLALEKGDREERREYLVKRIEDKMTGILELVKQQNKVDEIEKVDRFFIKRERFLRERFLRRLRQCHLNIRRLDLPRRSSDRKTPSQLRLEREMTMESYLNRPEGETLEVVEIPGKGRGVRSKIKFAKGEYICEYIGDFMTGEIGKLMELEHERNEDAGCFMFFLKYKSEDYCIDATSESSKIGRLINHSRMKANSVPRVWELRPGEPRLIFEATREIEAGEELLYDYNENRGRVRESFEWLKE